ncbi:hypothetical protein GGTG_12669 [Gaeumannomyces tritici R3-111a-1]|uniref:Uncharacterized protein n=1 Tax=Gaeumannomyces tritici (strain R3-111a-1) TaxID=644352 RepID=J3PGP0_GAET3|nr:hypothetical protein GGTG_12669 [Gaeumannomyces tritici R3-111a-1]EJT69786.1 hypothetical protein GGTG_12669 [Gaeumannomyces tritici R3-111a-1]
MPLLPGHHGQPTSPNPREIRGAWVVRDQQPPPCHQDKRHGGRSRPGFDRTGPWWPYVSAATTEDQGLFPNDTAAPRRSAGNTTQEGRISVAAETGADGLMNANADAAVKQRINKEYFPRPWETVSCGLPRLSCWFNTHGWEEGCNSCAARVTTIVPTGKAAVQDHDSESPTTLSLLFRPLSSSVTFLFSNSISVSMLALKSARQETCLFGERIRSPRPTL